MNNAEIISASPPPRTPPLHFAPRSPFSPSRARCPTARRPGADARRGTQPARKSAAIQHTHDSPRRVPARPDPARPSSIHCLEPGDARRARREVRKLLLSRRRLAVPGAPRVRGASSADCTPATASARLLSTAGDEALTHVPALRRRIGGSRVACACSPPQARRRTDSAHIRRVCSAHSAAAERLAYLHPSRSSPSARFALSTPNARPPRHRSVGAAPSEQGAVAWQQRGGRQPGFSITARDSPSFISGKRPQGDRYKEIDARCSGGRRKGQGK